MEEKAEVGKTSETLPTQEEEPVVIVQNTNEILKKIDADSANGN
jgi:hypothetical protein